MAKLLVFVAVIALIWFVARASRRKPEAPPAATEHMVGCAHCGVHFPAAESFRADGADYCCEEHRRLGAGS